jgi:hypothetical protein
VTIVEGHSIPAFPNCSGPPISSFTTPAIDISGFSHVTFYVTTVPTGDATCFQGASATAEWSADGVDFASASGNSGTNTPNYGSLPGFVTIDVASSDGSRITRITPSAVGGSEVRLKIFNRSGRPFEVTAVAYLSR